MGTGWHFVLEDYHGYRQYPTPKDAWNDYVRATLAVYGEELMPNDWRGLQELGAGMADYYPKWLVGRDVLDTYIVDGIPQTEVNFKIPLPVEKSTLERLGIDVVYYNGTLDRVICDPFGNLCIGEYKTAKAIYKAHYLTDPQITAYAWASKCIYDREINGVYYYQFKKALPDEPTILKSGLISCNKQMSTTHRFYRDVLIRMYGDVSLAPKVNVDHLNWLAGTETMENDGFISRDFIERNDHSLQAEGAKIMMELEEMLNPNLALYPNPTRECTMFPCDFRDPCIAIDEGDNFQAILDDEYQSRGEDKDSWRHHLQTQNPAKLLILEELPEHLLPQLAPQLVQPQC